MVGAGRVGGAIARGLAERAWPVLVTARRESELGPFEGVETAVLELGAGGARPAATLERVAAFGPDHVVVSVGGAGREESSLVDASPEAVEVALDTNLRPHLLAATTLLPLVRGRPDSTFLWINGGTAFAPAPGRGLVSIAAAAQLMLKDVLAAETPGGPRVLTLAILAPVGVPELETSLPKGTVAEAVASLLDGEEADGATMVLDAEGRLRRRD